MAAHSRSESTLRSWQNKLINPVLDKEFRLRMRSPRAMFAMMFYLFSIGALGLGYIYVTNVLGTRYDQGFNPDQSREMFYFIAFAQLGLIAFMAPGLTAGAISGEREKQTLNLLLTTQQSSTTIIISKLISSLGFMILVVLSTLPIYSIVFLYGGISPRELALVFLFYIFTMFALGSFGIMFSTLFKRTMISVIVTYGFGLLLFVGTFLLWLLLRGIFEQLYGGGNAPMLWIGHVLGFNPGAAMLSMFMPDVSLTAFNVRWTNSNRGSAPIELWVEYLIFYTVLSATAIWISIRYIRPRMKFNKKG